MAKGSYWLNENILLTITQHIYNDLLYDINHDNMLIQYRYSLMKQTLVNIDIKYCTSRKS